MPTTTDYLNQLSSDKQDLVDNLNTQGVEASSNETFTDLVPKVLDIVGGADLTDYYYNSCNLSGTTSSTGLISAKLWDQCIKNIPDDIVWNVTTTNLGYAFWNYKGTSLNLNTLNTSNVTNMTYMFYNCSNLTSLDLSHLNTSKVTNMTYMFCNAKIDGLVLPSVIYATDISSLFANAIYTGNILDLSNYSFPNATNISNMFKNINRSISQYIGIKLPTFSSQVSSCIYLFGDNMSGGSTFINNIDMNGFVGSNITSTQGMFSNCHDLQEIDLSSLEPTNLTNTTSMFFGCTSLKKIDIRKLNFSNVTSYNNMFKSDYASGVPYNCLIIVADATQKAWLNTKFPSYTNIKTVAEYEASL